MRLHRRRGPLLRESQQREELQPAVCAACHVCRGGLGGRHRHHVDIGPHIMELQRKFDDIKSTADDVIQEIDGEMKHRN